jgi:hypothetical protein
LKQALQINPDFIIFEANPPGLEMQLEGEQSTFQQKRAHNPFISPQQIKVCLKQANPDFNIFEANTSNGTRTSASHPGLQHF